MGRSHRVAAVVENPGHLPSLFPGNGISRPENKMGFQPCAHEKHAGKAKTKASSRRESRPGSKQARVLAMLGRAEGTTITAIMRATDWQQHSVRGFLAGVVRKRLKLKLRSKKVDGQRIYQIAVANNGMSGARQSRRRPS
jgi:hypothetical protein